ARSAPNPLRLRLLARVFAVALLGNVSIEAQSIALPWSGHGHDAQHSGISQVAARPLSRVLWQTPVDLAPQYSGSSLLIHYGSPLITRQNTIIIPVKTGPANGFRVEARDPADGSLK